jgi:hypothetical protein
MITETDYKVSIYNKTSLIVENLESDEAHIVDLEDKTCTCQDFIYRSKLFKIENNKEYFCKHFDIALKAVYEKKPAKIRRLYDTFDKSSELSVLS